MNTLETINPTINVDGIIINVNENPTLKAKYQVVANILQGNNTGSKITHIEGVLDAVREFKRKNMIKFNHNKVSNTFEYELTDKGILFAHALDLM